MEQVVLLGKDIQMLQDARKKILGRMQKIVQKAEKE